MTDNPALENLFDFDESIDGLMDPAIDRTWFCRVPGTTTTICAITLDNGFTVIGQSACVSASAFDAKLGARYAAVDALQKIGPFMGFRECDRRMEQP